jgi:hypothetical protein
MTPEEKKAWQDEQLRRLSDILSFLNAVGNDAALLNDQNRTGITRCHSIAEALLQLGIGRLGSLKTVGDVRSFMKPFRDDLANFIEMRDCTDETDA